VRIARVTDSTASIHDVDPGLRWHVVPLEVEIDGVRYREGPELTAAAFHALIQQVNTPPATLPPSVETFAEVYGALLDDHDAVLSIHLSGELSDTVCHARAAAERLAAGDRIVVFDSRLAGVAVGLLCAEAERRLARGEDLAAVVRALERIVAEARAYFSVYTLDFLYLGGRLERQPRDGAGSADDRPILALEDGRLDLVERVVGETTRVERILELLDAEFGPGEPLVTAIVHAGERGEAAAQRLEEVLTGERPSPVRCFRAPLGPVLCAHTGFDVCGVAVYPASLSALDDHPV
jgi:DegV family protein with EDD domain